VRAYAGRRNSKSEQSPRLLQADDFRINLRDDVFDSHDGRYTQQTTYSMNRPNSHILHTLKMGTDWPLTAIMYSSRSCHRPERIAVGMPVFCFQPTRKPERAG
jgi:hypothetical protein